MKFHMSMSDKFSENMTHNLYESNKSKFCFENSFYFSLRVFTNNFKWLCSRMIPEVSCSRTNKKARLEFLQS